MEYIYYKKNVPFPLAVREHPRDSVGLVLTEENPFVSVDKERLRDFIAANKLSITEGKLIEIPEPPLVTQTTNSITDEEALLLVKNFFALRKKLPDITSETTLFKLLSVAKSNKRPEKTIELIQSRLEEVTPVGMKGVDEPTKEV